ncbi:lysozyme [Panaeolus papilionaceus]|nr:lysozyme [Panaeolus papilionaceus]
MLSVYLILLGAVAANAALNGPCTVSGTPGVCIKTSSCSSSGGTSHTGFCPNDPADVKCCTKPSCGNNGGKCQFANTCASGKTVTGLCPGPADFKCCLPGGATTPSGSTPPKAGCSPSKVNSATIAMLKGFEGFVGKPYLDPVGLETVGYGHLCRHPGCTEVPFSFPMTEAQATTLLQSDLAGTESCISNDINDTIQLNENQYGALVSWAFNVGCGNSKSSAMISRLNAGEDPNTVASDELPKWRKGGGQVLPGLVNRRKAEVEFFKRPSSTIAHPPTC